MKIHSEETCKKKKKAQMKIGWIFTKARWKIFKGGGYNNNNNRDRYRWWMGGWMDR